MCVLLSSVCLFHCRGRGSTAVVAIERDIHKNETFYSRPCDSLQVVDVRLLCSVSTCACSHVVLGLTGKGWGGGQEAV